MSEKSYVTHDFLQGEFRKVKGIIDDDFNDVKNQLNRHELKNEEVGRTLTNIQVNIQKLVSHAENEERSFPLIVDGFKGSIKILRDEIEEAKGLAKEAKNKADDNRDKLKYYGGLGAGALAVWEIIKAIKP